MSIAMVGHSAAVYTPDGGLVIAWPDGTAAGHTAVVVTATSGSRKPASKLPAGWKLLRSNSAGEAVWGKLALTAADIADSLDLNAVISGLMVLSGVVAFGGTSASKGVTLTSPAGAMVTFGRKAGASPALTPPTGRVFDTDAVNDKFSSYKKKKKKHWRTRRYNAWLTNPGVKGYVSITSNAESLISVELLGSVTGTSTGVAMTPVALTPADDSSILSGGPYAFSWALPPAFRDPQWTLRHLQLRVVGAGSWGSVSGGVWTPANADRTESWTFTGSQTSTRLSSGLAAGTSCEWRVRTMYAGSLWSAWSAPAQFKLVAPPVIGAVSMTAALKPFVSWTLSSGSQAYAQVKILTAAGAVLWDSGLVGQTALSMAVPLLDWVNGGAYRAQVQVTSADGMVSSLVTSAAVTIAWTPPSAPTALTGTQGAPLTLTVWGLGSVHDQVRISWTVHGDDYQVVVAAAVGTVTVPMPAAPYGACTYTVEASKLDGDVPLWSTGRTAAVTNTDRGTYLATDDLTGWLPVRIHTASEPVDSEGITVSYPLGSARPVTLRTPSTGLAGTDVLFVADQVAKDALLAWLEDHPTGYFRRPPEWAAGVGFVDAPCLHISRTAARSELRIANADIQMRKIPISWVEV